MASALRAFAFDRKPLSRAMPETPQDPGPPIERPGARLRQTRTREVLLSAARRLMAHGSRAAFTVDEVVQAAGVAKGSFYNHFPDKESIEKEVYRAVREMEEAEVRKVNRGIADPVTRIARGMAVYARMALDAPEDAQILILGRIDSGFIQSSVNAGLAADLRAALHDDRIVAPSIEAAAMLVVGQVAMLIARLGGNADTVAAQSAAQQSIAITLVGIGLSHRDAQLVAAQAVDAILSAPSTPPR